MAKTTDFNVALENFHRPNLLASLKLCDNTSPTEKLIDNFYLADLNQRTPHPTWIRYMDYLR